MGLPSAAGNRPDLRLGLEGEWHGCRGLFVYGKTAASFLGGMVEVNYLQTSSTVNQLIAETTWKEAQFVEIGEGELGAGWAASAIRGYPHQAGVGHMTEDRGEDGYRGDLNHRCVTIAEVLRSAGYRTGMTGKWHVTKYVNPETDAQKFNWPRQRGFDHYLGIIGGGADYFNSQPLTCENERVQPGEGFYTTDAFVDHAIRFVDQGEKAKPFFQYIAFNAPHFPLMAPQDEIARFRGKYKIGWDRLRAAAARQADRAGRRGKAMGAVSAAEGRQGVG